jgi:histone H4
MNKKHTKVYKDNIQGITAPAIRRLAHKGGVKTMSNSIYYEIRIIIKVHLESVIRRAVLFTESAQRNTVQDRDVREALNVLGRPAVFADGKQVKKQITTQSGKVINRTVKEHTKTKTTNCLIYQGKRHGKEGQKKKIYVGGGDGGSDRSGDELGGDELHGDESDDENDYEPNLEDFDEYEEEDYKMTLGIQMMKTLLI